MKSIAVLMPCYNAASYVGDALSSVIAQTYKDWELFVYDDGSTDESCELVSRFCALDDRIHLISSDSNQGIPVARNILLDQVSEQFFAVAWLDADDFARCDRFEMQLKYLLEKKLDACGSSVVMVDGHSEVLGIKKFPVKHEDIIRKISRANPIAQSSVLIRRDAIMIVGRYDCSLQRAQDYDYWFRLLEAGLCLGNMAEPLVYFRCHDLQGRATKDRLSIACSIRVRLRHIKRKRFFSFAGFCVIVGYCVVYLCPKFVRQKTTSLWSYFSRL